METRIDSSSQSVALNVPEHLRYQLVYQKTFALSDRLTNQGNDTTIDYLLVSNPIEGIFKFPLLSRTFGPIGTAKIILKTLTGKRQFFGAILDGKLAHHGWFSIGFCRHYHVEKYDIIIGSIWTDKSARGKGLATKTIQHAMQRELKGPGERTFHIDTAWDNLPCQKVIERLGFGPPVALYIRGRKSIK